MSPKLARALAVAFVAWIAVTVVVSAAFGSLVFAMLLSVALGAGPSVVLYLWRDQ